MTTLKVGVASYEDMKARTMAVARGERAYQESCGRGHNQPGDGLGETHDHTERTD
jgi:predicted transcriptional regulator